MCKRREAWKLLGIIPKELAGLSGCQNATSAINFLDEQHEMTPGSPHQRITGTSANALLFSSRTLTFGEWPWYSRYMAGHGEVLFPTSHRDATEGAFPGFQPRVSLQCQPSRHLDAAHHTRTSLFDSWYQGCFPYVKISPQHDPPGSRRHFRWWTSYTWCSLGASSEWAALCGHRPGRKGVSRTASVTWKPSSIIRGKSGRGRGAFFPFICIY